MSRAAPAIRRLAPCDAGAYRALRLRALREYPTAFTSSDAEEAARAPGWSEQRLQPDPDKPHDFFLGAFQDEVLLGMAGLQGRYRPKERHNATVVSVFVAPEGARHGLGMALMQDLLARARALHGLEQLDLTVTEGNDTAQRLYARCGFSVYGVLPHAIKVNGRDHAKVLMVLRLR
jgi:ribosomal protein S18 acetylase RimI-like enzyme